MINKELMRDRFAKNLDSYNDNAKVQKRMAEKLITMAKNKAPRNNCEELLLLTQGLVCDIIR